MSPAQWLESCTVIGGLTLELPIWHLPQGKQQMDS